MKTKRTKAHTRKNPCPECGAIFGNNHLKACKFAYKLPPDSLYCRLKKLTPEQREQRRKKKKQESWLKYRQKIRINNLSQKEGKK